MASLFGHGLLAWSIGRLPPFDHLGSKTRWIGIGSSMLPDLDVVAFRFGIPYEHMLGHRGFTHALIFAMGWAWLMNGLFFKKGERTYRRWLFLFICTASHGLLDACTSGGRGVGFFIPFTGERYFFPWRPILVSPLSAADFFSEWGWRVLLSEAVYIGLPAIVLMVIGWLLRYKNR